ncbi:DUF2842 domain-containing protein, partial [Cereibacter sediminicola]|uniref:DUF2842 domain-containing protein n=1 Tax=Cereibacter sediminicola TaxID=2584941 RepID=UPI0011A23EF2
MALSYKTRRRLSLLVLIVGMPLYIVAAVELVDLFDRPPFWLELVIYVALGIVWILPLKPIFIGVGQADPDASEARGSSGRDTCPWSHWPR